MPGHECGISPKQLMAVFQLCDPEGSGRVKIEYLQRLAKVYSAGDAKVWNFNYY